MEDLDPTTAISQNLFPYNKLQTHFECESEMKTFLQISQVSIFFNGTAWSINISIVLLVLAVKIQGWEFAQIAQDK